MRIYKASVANGEQRFAANIISISKELIAFGDLLPTPGKAIRYGIPIHTLLIHLDGAQTMFELNDQGNTRDWGDVERLEVTATSLRLVFAQGCGPFSGRVSLAPEIEIFDRDDHESHQLRSVLVEMTPTPAQLTRIKSLLGRALQPLAAPQKSRAPRKAKRAVPSKRASARKRRGPAKRAPKRKR